MSIFPAMRYPIATYTTALIGLAPFYTQCNFDLCTCKPHPMEEALQKLQISLSTVVLNSRD